MHINEIRGDRYQQRLSVSVTVADGSERGDRSEVGWRGRCKE